LNAAQQTKNEIGDGYNMKGSSSIKKEWYEQAESFAKYITGKTISEVKGISLDDSGHATNSDLKSSVTIKIGDFITVVEKAVSAAK